MTLLRDLFVVVRGIPEKMNEVISLGFYVGSSWEASALRGTLALKATKILRGTDLKVGGDRPPLKKSWGGRAPPRPLGSYAPG